jgi:hypothetical protein
MAAIALTPTAGPTKRQPLSFCSSLNVTSRSLNLAKSALKGRTMAEPIGAIGAPTAATYAVEVTRKEQDQQELQGQQAVQLIQSASAPKPETSGSVGTKLHFVG